MRTGHTALGGMTPLVRYLQDLPRIRSLDAKAATLDSLFYHRVTRFVKKNGTVSYLGQQFEVPYELSGKTVKLVLDPHGARVIGVENDTGQSLGDATALDLGANLHRVRRKPEQPGGDDGVSVLGSTPKRGPGSGGGAGPNLVELAHQQYYAGAAVSSSVPPATVAREACDVPSTLWPESRTIGQGSLRAPEFFRDLPAFLNFAFDSRDLISIWLVGHPGLAHTLERAPYAALASRIQVRVELKPIVQRERFAQLIEHAFKSAGCAHTSISESGMEIVHQASKGGQHHPVHRHAIGHAQRAQPSAR